MDAQHMTPLSFTLNEQLVVKAGQLAALHFAPRFLWFGGMIGVTVASYFALLQEVWSAERLLMQFALSIAGGLMMATIVIAILRYGVIPFEARRNFRQQKGLSDAFSLSWTDVGFILEGGMSRTSMPFANLYGFCTSDELIILRHSQMIYNVIPAAAFDSPEMRDAFVQRLVQAGVRRR